MSWGGDSQVGRSLAGRGRGKGAVKEEGKVKGLGRVMRSKDIDEGKGAAAAAV